MVKLTPELIQQTVQHFNPVKDRELVLRGYKIPVIENLGATMDQFDTYDLSDNDIRKLDGFPLLKRLKSLLLNNNKIGRLAEDLQEYLPNLNSIYLTNNLIEELKDLEPLSKLTKLEFVSLLGNPVTTKLHYRLFVIYKVPQVRVIDFRRVKLHERETAKKLFKSKEGKDLKKEIKRTRTFTPGGALARGVSNKAATMSAEEQEAVRQAIANAKSMEEVEKLQQMLRSGISLNDSMEVELEEE